MRIDRYISSSRVIDLKNQDLHAAYSELLGTFSNLLPSSHSRKKILDELITREQAITSYLGEGVALPHARVKMKRPFALAIGRCPTGLSFEGQGSYDEIRYVFLLLANENAKNYLSFLATLARTFQDKSVMDHLWMARDLLDFKTVVRHAFAGTDERLRAEERSLTNCLQMKLLKLPKLRTAPPFWYSPMSSRLPLPLG